MEVLVFTNEGKTFMFKNVSEFRPTTQGFEFIYVGEATKETRKVNFNYTSVAGYAKSGEGIHGSF